MNELCPQQSAYAARVYIFDHHPEDLEITKRSLLAAGLHVVTRKLTHESLHSVRNDPDAGCVICELNMPWLSGLKLFSTLQQYSESLATIILTRAADASTCRYFMRLGVFDFLEKWPADDELATSVRQALIKHRIELNAKRKKADRMTRVDALTNREIDVVKLLSRGSALKEVGTELKITVQTASKHRSSIFEKLDVSNEVELHRTYSDCIALLESIK